MRSLVTASVFIIAGLMTSAGAQPGSSVTNPATREICVDVGGRSEPAVCQSPASRLDNSDDFCVCRSAQKVDAPVCGPGEKPPAESLAFEKARKAAARDGSLVGDTYDGRPMCIEPRNKTP
jgi:hypothetical protein